MKNKKIKYIGIIVVVLFVLVVGVFMIKQVFPTANAALEISNALKPFLNAENKAMHLVIDAGIDEKAMQFDLDLYAVKEEATDYLAVKYEDSLFYIVDDLILLENGKAFLLAEKQDTQGHMVSHMDLIALLAVSFDEFEISRVEKEERVTYQIEVTGEQVKKILDATVPMYSEAAETVERLQVQLTTQNGSLEEIQMKGMGVSKESKVSLSATISNFAVLQTGEYKIPQRIQDSARTADKDKLFSLTDDLYRLMKAVEPLSDRSKLQGDMNWKVSCGLIQMDVSMDLAKLNSAGMEDSEKTEKETSIKIMELIGAIIMEGEIRCTEMEGTYGYEIVLDETSMKQLVEAMAPEMISYAIVFEKGSMKLEVKEEQLSTITIGIEGAVNALFTKIPASVGVTFHFK